MSEAFLGEVRIVPFNFAPNGWAFCNGQIMPIGQNTALFSILGTTYGGDGLSNFALPNLQGSVPLQPGQGAGLSPYALGEVGGEAAVTLQQTQIPGHTHTLTVSKAVGTATTPSGSVVPAEAKANVRFTNLYAAPDANNPTYLAPAALATAGNSFGHNNLQPYLVLNFIIALRGVFPPRA